MSLLKTAVFLASRFEEFSEVRSRLKRLISDYPAVQLAPIDLNDGNVSHRPPLVECLSNVRRSEFMILLLGDTYGSLAPKSDKSFTHLEYEEAIKDGSGTRVLVFCIGNSYVNNKINYSMDPNLAAWQRQVEENHTIGFFDLSASVDVVAKGIFDKLLVALYDMSFGKLAADTSNSAIDELFDVLDDEPILDDAEVSALEERNNNGLPLLENGEKFKDVLTAITQPSAVAAAEQREEAQRALDIQEYGIAVKHLKRALELKPLEMTSNFWLAKLYVALGRKEKAQEAMELAERAARVADRERLPYRAAASYMIAARAANMAGHDVTALRHAQKATETAPRFARGHVELARQFALQNNSIDALKEIRQAYTLYPNSLREVFSDPTFRPMRNSIDSLMQEIKSMLARDVVDILKSEKEISGLLNKEIGDVIVDGKNISQLIDFARQSVRKQFGIVCSLVTKAVSYTAELDDNSADEDDTLATQEMLRFTRSGNAQIVEWYREPGDYVQPGDAVFSFFYQGSSTVKPWSFRGRTPVRMIARVGPNGSWVSSESPFVFSHVPASLPIKKVSVGSKLRAELKDVSALLDHSSNELNNLVTQRDALVGGVGFSPFFNYPGAIKIILTLVVIVCGFFYFGASGFRENLMLFIITMVIGLYFFRDGWEELSAHRQQIADLKLAIDGAKDRYQALYEEHESISKKIGSMESGAKLTQQLAKQALSCFERRALRKSTRLLPFSSVYSAIKDDVVKGTEKQLESIKCSSNRELIVNEDRPDWLNYDMDKKNPARLYMVIETNRERLVLSTFHAYCTAKEDIV